MNTFFVKFRKQRWILSAVALAVVVAIALIAALPRDSFKRTQVTLAKGLPSQTAMHILDSGKPGKTIFFLAGTHGNEEAGYNAARLMLENLRPLEGRILIVPEANKRAIEAYIRTSPEGVDMNRSYPGAADGNDIEQLCAEIMDVIQAEKPVAVVDMHEGHNFYGVNGSIGNSVVAGLDAEAFLVLPEILDYVNSRNGDLPDFTYDTNAPQGSLNCESHEHFGVDSFTIETTQQLDIDTRVAQQLNFVEAFLTIYGIPYTLER